MIPVGISDLVALSILYLRCHPLHDCVVCVCRVPFNSLFEMQEHGLDNLSNRRIRPFNSLFEMQF